MRCQLRCQEVIQITQNMKPMDRLALLTRAPLMGIAMAEKLVVPKKRERYRIPLPTREAVHGYMMEVNQTTQHAHTIIITPL